MLAISEINDSAVRTAEVYLYKDGALQNQEGETRRLLWFQGKRVLIYHFPPEENAAYEVWVEARSKEFLYRYCVCTMSEGADPVPVTEPSIAVYRLSGEPVYTIEAQPGGGRELVLADGAGGT